MTAAIHRAGPGTDPANHPVRVGTGHAVNHYPCGMCLLILLLLLGPRAAIVVWWLVSPIQWNLTFGGILLPILGFLILPWTTLMYMLVAPGGVVGLDYLWLGLAFVVDLSSHAAGAYSRRRRAVA